MVKLVLAFLVHLGKAKAAGYLDDIKETVVDNQRVLAVSAMHRRKIAGSLLGSSKSGNIVYMATTTQSFVSAPSSITESPNGDYNDNANKSIVLNNTIDLTDVIGANVTFWTKFDIENNYDYAQFQISTNGGNAKFSQKVNRVNGFASVDYNFNDEQKLIVISGPNAGGKSITLKTIGLLQLMLQSGILIPVDERSQTYVFDSILSDIGDNQSIENQLSTYSYRLKNMKYLFAAKFTVVFN